MMRHSFRILMFFLLFSIFAVYLCPDLSAAEKKVRYVLLFIGDGMGENQIKAAQAALTGAMPGAKLSFTQLPVKGYLRTNAWQNVTTDSAAAGTAMACGVKTGNGQIGIGPNGEKLVNIAEIAKQSGLKVGLVSSAALNDATPAAFYAHAGKRRNYLEIAMQAADGKVDFFGGGCFAEDKNNSVADTVVPLLKSKGYKVVNGRQELSRLETSATEKLCVFEKMRFVINPDGGKSLTTAELTTSALRQLANDGGFFLMVEGGRIDHACHSNDGAAMIMETLDFDKAVNIGLAFYAKHPDETLLLVTADHETGGLAVDEKKLAGTAQLIFRQNADIGRLSVMGNELKKQRTAFGDYEKFLKEKCALDNFTGAENDLLRKVWSGTAEIRGRKLSPGAAGTYLVNSRCGLTFSSFGHTLMPVVIYAVGPGSERFRDTHENTQVFTVINEVLR